MASAAIGVSHLVQSTRAGAEYGFALIGIVILANLFKYPFLEFGPRYAIATKKTLIEGYVDYSKWAIGFFIVFTLGTMFTVHAVVTLVTAGLASNLTGIHLEPVTWSAIILGVCILILITGKYSVLDGFMKIIMVTLAISTVTAVFSALFSVGAPITEGFSAPSVWTIGGISFLIALMGWMPIPVDASAWHSIWSVERIKQTGYTPKLRESLFDFNVGYIGAALLALCFLLLGAMVMYGSGQAFAENAADFSTQLISMYTSSLGVWAYPVIVIAAFTTMFGTTLAVTDTYPRVCRYLLHICFPKTFSDNSSYRLFLILIISVSAGAWMVLYFLGNQFRYLIDLATTLSFLGAPVLGYINYQLVFDPAFPDKYRPSKPLQWLAISGLLFLTGFALFYIWWRVMSIA
jgi:Mn2+/Fe2+ NRAMP family transporter